MAQVSAKKKQQKSHAFMHVKNYNTCFVPALNFRESAIKNQAKVFLKRIFLNVCHKVLHSVLDATVIPFSWVPYLSSLN